MCSLKALAFLSSIFYRKCAKGLSMEVVTVGRIEDGLMFGWM